MTARIKVGLLGAGYILDSHASALQALPNVEIHAVCDQSQTRATHAAIKFGIPHVTQSIEELATSACDVVHVLLPPALHLDAAQAMIAKGKSVFLEKPMGLDSTACAALCSRAAERGVAIGVNHNFLFSRAYEQIRQKVKSGELGQIDHLSVNWHFALPIVQFGPFDTWMLAAPANLLFELGPHVAAFIVDLIGMPKIVAADAGNAIGLPTGQTVFRHWTALGRNGPTTALFSISTTAGQSDRILRLRGRGGSAQLDFGRDIGWFDLTATDNPIFDSHRTAQAAGKALSQQASRDRYRRVRAALTKRPDANPFDETVFRSISTFYSRGFNSVDPRHDGGFATDVIRLCEAVTTAASVGSPSRQSVSIAMPRPTKAPKVLVVGGTGFIGRRLVRALIDRGHGVRVQTRNPHAAAAEFGQLPIELVGGSHGDPEAIRQALDGIETVYHLAKCEGKRWQDYLERDIVPTRVLAEAAVVAGVHRFIYTGTIASYDSTRRHVTIDNRTPIDRRIQRRGHYARSKGTCEILLQEMQRTKGLPLVIMRPAIVIGPGSPPGHPGVGRFASENRVDYWGSGENFLPLVLADDVAEALALALDAPAIEGQTLLLTSPPLLTARDYVDALSAYMRTRIDARPRSAWRYWLADITKELAKNSVRHPNRRWPTLHDWRCNSHAARYDGQMTEEVLAWRPVADRETMVIRGIHQAVDWHLR